MWPWKRKPADDVAATLPGRVSDLESELRRLKLEWTDVLDRLERMAGRLAKRREREAAVLSPEETPPAKPNGAPPARGGAYSELMRQVAARRSPHKPPGQ